MNINVWFLRTHFDEYGREQQGEYVLPAEQIPCDAGSMEGIAKTLARALPRYGECEVWGKPGDFADRALMFAWRGGQVKVEAGGDFYLCRQTADGYFVAATIAKV